ncbi:hypothetical protein GCM10027049_18380 [Mucilaginibacter puniceus]
MRIILLACFLFTGHFVNAQSVAKVQTLFNGTDLKGWYTFFNSKGKNNDPDKVFTVHDKLLHITGQEFGYIATEKSYKDFHLVVEFKWGIKKYAPRAADTTKRDNGICFFVPANAADKVWPKSIECQIQEGDVGDIWLIDYTTVVVDGKRTVPKDYNRVQKKKDGEKPNGEWNRVEVIANKGKIQYIVNGVVVNEAESPSETEGKILVQSEGAEIYYRKIEITEL